MPEIPALDVLALAAHPDDVELSAGGTMCLLARQNYLTGIVDLTRGELGSRGSPELRREEAAEAGRIMGLTARENLGIPDGAISNTTEHRLRIIRTIRRYRPHIVLISAPVCRHPDHSDAAVLSAAALFAAGLRKVATLDENGAPQEPWRPHHVLHYMQTIPFEPTFVVDVSEVWDDRIRALQAFKSQFYNPEYVADEDEPETFVSNEGFFHWVEARARTYGHHVGARFGEPFLYRHGPVGTHDLVATLRRERPFR
jgi:N-acetylglucosamine malate deacetylase 1